jgi:hypothetical protein
LDYWNLLCTLQEQEAPVKIKTLPERIAEYCPIFDDDGKERPLIVGAAAGFRREFIRMVAMALPEEGFKPPRCSSDKGELVIANYSDPARSVQSAFSDIEEVKELLSRARPDFKVTTETDLKSVVELLEQEFESRLRQLEKFGQVKRKKIVLRPLADAGYFLGQADRINKATIEAFAFGAMRPVPVNYAESLGRDTSFWNAHMFSSGQPTSGRDYLIGAIGFKEEPAERIQRLLRKNGALAIKAQYTLWARAYAETDAAPGIYITLTITQFCDDIGLARHNGAHRPESKLVAMTVLELLTSMDLICIYRPPHGPVQRIRGPIWSRGMISEELRGYEDVFQGTSLSNRPLWTPKAFSYAPGPFFANETWRAYNKYIALVGEGLLKLRSDNSDKYAVMVGGYLAILARMNGYRQTKVSVGTLLEKTGLWAVDRNKNPSRMIEKLETALDRLREVGVIEKGEIPYSKEDIDANNLDDRVTLNNLAKPKRWSRDIVEKILIVDWPVPMKKRELELRKKRERYIKESVRQSKCQVFKTA